MKIAISKQHLFVFLLGGFVGGIFLGLAVATQVLQGQMAPPVILKYACDTKSSSCRLCLPAENCEFNSRTECDAKCVVPKSWKCLRPNVCESCVAGERCPYQNDVDCLKACSTTPPPPLPVCGDAVVNPGEQCDDGNQQAGDGCNPSYVDPEVGNPYFPQKCVIEPGWRCTGSPSLCTPTCGDGKVIDDEQCDDSNRTKGDGCSDTCRCEQWGTSCRCIYQDFPECHSALDEISCQKMIPAGFEKEGECRWNKDEQGGGTCISRFEHSCTEWLAEQVGCTEKKKIKDDPSHPLDYVTGKACTNIRIKIRKHGNPEMCGTLSSQIEACIQTSGSNCKMDFVQGSCSIFENHGELIKHIDTLQKQLKPGQILDVSSNQTVSSDICQTMLHFNITCKDVTLTADPCYPVGTFCHIAHETALCSDNGSFRNQVCCKDGTGNRQWRLGKYCPKAGSCQYNKSAFFCSAANAAAQKQVGDCMTQAKLRCGEEGGVFTEEACDYKYTSGLFSCTYAGECGWECEL